MGKQKFCEKCTRKTCLKTGVLCVRLSLFLEKNVEKQFWHGVESFMDKPTFDFLQQKLYGIGNDEDMEEK